MDRSLACETILKIQEKVILYGWVNTRRDHGGIVFIDLRDRSGLVQLVLSKEKAVGIGSEDVIKVSGTVKNRPEKLINPKLASGKVEVEVEQVQIINHALELPFSIATNGYEINEEARMKYRYLDIRRPRMVRNLRLRSQASTFIRNFLTQRDFLEIETPILTKTTPEGARDFIVPSRLQKGKFYALPQSPQQYKQLLMVAGVERYFQIARCFRDEDPRADRAYGEFTQLDLEMSYVTQNDILELIEEMFTELIAKIFPDKYVSTVPWPRISHREAAMKWGSDKPDIRKNKNDKNELAFAWIIDFPLFKEQTQDDFFHGSGKAKFAPSHHMFTSPHPDDVSLLATNPLKVRGLQHDLVLNGYEAGGGSIRIHDPKVQEKVFDLIGFTSEQKKQFSHMLTAFKYGVPPHGGIAPGIDRFLFVALGEPSIREMMAFPTSSSGQTSVMEAPSWATPLQLQELGISISNNEKGVFLRIKALLDDANISYRVIEHEAVFTSEQSAKIRGTNIHQGAKALVMIADQKPVVIVLPADLKADLKKLKDNLQINDLRMASKEEVEKFTKTQVGAVPPFGNIFGLPLYIDNALLENEEIAFNAGKHTVSIVMKIKDYIKSASGKLGDYSTK